MISPAARFARDQIRTKTQDGSDAARKALESATAKGASAIASWGLLQAVLFWETKSRGTDEAWLCQVLASWFAHDSNPRRHEIDGLISDALLDLTGAATYSRLTTDALEMFSFLKRFAKVAAEHPPGDPGAPA